MESMTRPTESTVSELDDAVAKVWERIFGVPASRGDGLLDVLADSLGEARSQKLGLLLAEIAAATGVNLPLTAVCGSPTARTLSEMVRRREWTTYVPSVATYCFAVGNMGPTNPNIGETGRPVVFLFPGLTGVVGELDPLCAGCDPLIRFISLNYPHWSTVRRDGINFKTLIEHLRLQVENNAPFGPIRLAGYSFGGHIAFSVAAALVASGRSDVRVGLIDAPAFPTMTIPRRSVHGQLQHFVEVFRAGDVGVKSVYTMTRLLMGSRYSWPLKLAAKLYHLRPRLSMVKHMDIAFQMNSHLLILRELLAWMAGLTAPLPFRTVLFRCAEQPPNSTDDLGWSRLLNDLLIVPIPGNHMNFMHVSNISSLCTSFVATMSDTPKSALEV